MPRLTASLILAALIAVAYGGSLRNELVFDELMFVERDPRVHELAVERIFLEALWSEGEEDHHIHQYYRPLQLLPLAVSYQLFGKAGWPSHLLNLLVHFANCLLVLGIFRMLLGWSTSAGARTEPPPSPLLGKEGGRSDSPSLPETVDFLRGGPSRRRQTTAAPQGERKNSFEINANTARAEEAAFLSGRLEAPLAHLSTVSPRRGLGGGFPCWPALAATALFAVHPGYSEAVLWVSDIAGLGAAFCILASVRLHMSPRRERWYGWVIAPLLVLCALWFKESGILAVVLVVLYDVVAAPDRGLRRAWRMRGRYLAFVPAAAVYLALRLHALGGALPGIETVPMSRSDMWINAIALLPKYVATFVWPFSLNMYHDFDAVQGMASLHFWGGVAILSTAVSIAVATLRSHRVVAFGTLWALLAVAPHLLVRWPQLNVFAERYLYLPSAGIFLVAGYVGSRLWRSLPAAERRSWIPAASLALVLTVFITVDYHRTLDWRDEESIYGKTLTQSTRAELIRTNLAVRYLDEKRYDEGIALLEPLLSINPAWHETRHNLGLLYMAKGETEKAIAAFEEARRRDPFKGATLLNLGYLYDRGGQRDEAVKRYLELVRREPGNAAAWYNLAVVAFEESQLRNSRFAAEQVLRISPEDRGARALLREIEVRDVVAEKLDVPPTRRRCGEAKRLLDRDRPKEAVLTLEMAAWLDEASPLPRHYLSNIYYLSGRLEKALEEKRAALQRAPNNELYRKNIAVLERALAEQQSSFPDEPQ